MDKNTDPLAPFRIGFLLIDGFALMSYAAAIEPLRAANLLAGHPLFEAVNIPAKGALARSSAGAEVAADARPADKPTLDMLLVVAGGDPTSFADRRVISWLRELDVSGVRLGGVSGGPVILAQAGLMKNRRMTVHWEHAPILAEFSDDLLLERSLFVRDRDRITCAGGVAPLDMLLALIAERQGDGFARKVADWFLHTEIRSSAGPQRAGLAERYATTSPPLLRMIDAMEQHLGSPLSLNALAAIAGCSARQLNRLSQQHLGLSSMAFYRRLRLEKSCVLLTQSAMSITEVALAAGFLSSAHFASAFQRQFEISPNRYRTRTKSAVNGSAGPALLSEF